MAQRFLDLLGKIKKSIRVFIYYGGWVLSGYTQMFGKGKAKAAPAAAINANIIAAKANIAAGKANMAAAKANAMAFAVMGKAKVGAKGKVVAKAAKANMVAAKAVRQANNANIRAAMATALPRSAKVRIYSTEEMKQRSKAKK